MREADEPSRGRVVRPMPETGPGTGQADVPEMRQVPVPRGRGHVRQVPGAPCVAILFSLRRAAAEGLAGRVVRPMPAAPFGEGEDMNLADVALEALYLLGVLMCCALLSREEGCVCSIESGPCERVDVFHVSGRFWSISACGEKRTPARPAWTSFPS